MRSPREMNAPSEMFFFLFNTVQECLGYFIFVDSRIRLVDFYVFQCNSKPKLNYENKDDKKFEVVLRRVFGDFKINFFDFDSQICFF